MITREMTKRLITAGIIALAAAVVIGYAYFASYGLLDGPSIITNTPLYSTATTSSALISGIAKRVNKLTLDGRPIVIDPQGNFSETISLSPGYNTEVLSGQDKFGRSTSVELSFVYNQ